jgi:hypothetical protein
MQRVNFAKGWSRAYRFTGRKDDPNIIKKWGCEGKSGVYAISNENDNEILYVGKATSIDVRLKDHMEAKGNGNISIASDISNGKTFILRWVLSNDPALSESIAIVILTPRYNGRCEWARGVDKVDLYSCLREAERIGLIESKEKVSENLIINLCQELDIRITAARAKKQEMCIQAEAINKSTNWKEAEEGLKKLQAEWKKIGYCGKDFDEATWIRFKNAIDTFYERRKIFFSQRDKDQEANKRRKEQICGEAESLNYSNDWKKVGEAFKALSDQWKSVGSSGKDNEDRLWQRFKTARDKFNERRSEYFNKQQREQLENLDRKWKICLEAQSLTSLGARMVGKVEDSIRRVKELQAEWKTIGHVPRDQQEEVQQQFRRACDKVFEWDRQERERKKAEWRDKMKEIIVSKEEQANRIRESIRHDEQIISQKREKIYCLRPGGRSYEIREALEQQIRDIQHKIDSKYEKVRNIESAIRDLDSKIYG